LPSRSDHDSLTAKDFFMDNRFLAIFVAVCFALMGTGCASKSGTSQRLHRRIIPAQTGSRLPRFIAGDESESAEKSKHHNVRVERAKAGAERESEEESTAPPDRFR
jgi:hypothetical protein